MDIKRALRSIFRSRWHIAALARAGVIACIPIIGQLVLAAYALHYIRAAALNDDSKPRDIRMDVQTLLIGFKCQLLTILGTVAAGLLTLPLWAIDRGASNSTDPLQTPTTALIDAFRSPTSLLTATLAALFTALCLARFAMTGRALSALDLAETWAHLRAQPSLWITATVVGFVLSQAPTTVALLLPLSADQVLPALLIATALLWPVTLFIQSHLIGQAFQASAQTIANRRPLIVRVRW